MLAIVKKLRASKVFISFLVCLMLVFSYEVNKPKAVAPVVGWGAAVLAGVMVEQMASMGFRWWTKSQGKKKADEWAAAMWSKSDEPFDFAKTNPYLNKDGSVYISPSAADRARIASFLAGATGGMLAEDLLNPDGTYACVPSSSGDMSYSFDGLNLTVENATGMNWDFVKAYYKPFVEYYDDTRPTTSNMRIGLKPRHDNEKWAVQTIVGRNQSVLLQNFGNAHAPEVKQNHQGTLYAISNETWVNSDSFLNAAWNNYNSTNATGECLYNSEADGFTFPSTIHNVYNYNFTDSMNNYPLPNFPQLENKQVLIRNIMPISETEGAITWGDIENQYNSEEEAIIAIENGVVNYYDGGLLDSVPITEADVNNDYTDKNQEKKKAQVDEEKATFLPPAENPGTLPVIPNVEPINRGMLQVITESYQYLADGVDNSIDSMRTVTDSATGLISYLDTSFRWLPAEWRAMFGAAFVLGVFAHFFRR